MAKYESSTLAAAAAAKPAARIQPTSAGFITVTLLLTAVSFLGAFSVSANAQLWLASLLHLPPWLGWALVATIDAPLVVFGLSALARRSRGDSAWLSYTALSVFTAGSIALNIFHGLELTEPGTSMAATVAISGAAAAAPLAVLLTSESALSIVVAPPSGDREHRAALQRVADRGALPTVKPTRRSGAERKDLEAAARDMAEGGRSRAEIAAATGLSAQAVRNALAEPTPAFRL